MKGMINAAWQEYIRTLQSALWGWTSPTVRRTQTWLSSDDWQDWNGLQSY
jgi:hypothetical protein